MQHTGHPNEMMLWPEIGCRRGCAEHATVVRNVVVGGTTKYHDYTSIPTRFTRTFDIEIWDTTITPVDGGPYCPARDAVSETILSHGVWEPQETTLLLECFEQLPGGLFIDFGSQVGWFSTLATLSGMTVIALDADPDCVALTDRNLLRNMSETSSVGSYRERLGPDVAVFSLDDDQRDLPTVVKIDVEGAERYAIEKIQPLIDDHWVKYLLIEISPCFNDSYDDIINGLVGDGFVPYELPPKQIPPVQLDRLINLKPFELINPTPRRVRNFLDSIRQVDMLFAYEGIG